MIIPRDDKKICYRCRHYRGNKPKESYCTVKKDVVDFMAKDGPCFVLRKNFWAIIESNERRMRYPKHIKRAQRRLEVLRRKAN
jgi:hypothetical protein